MTTKRIKFFGLPGSGKTTVIDVLKETLKIKLKVINDKLPSTEMLRQLWSNPTQNCVTFQHLLIEKEEEEEKKIKNCEFIKNYDFIIDHTPIETIEFFNHAYLASSYISGFNYDHLQRKCNKVRIEREPDQGEDDIYVFLYTPIFQTLENIKKRNRAEELFHEEYIFTHIHYAIESFKGQNLFRKHITIPYEENHIDITGICGLLDLETSNTSFDLIPVPKNVSNKILMIRQNYSHS